MNKNLYFLSTVSCALLWSTISAASPSLIAASATSSSAKSSSVICLLDPKCNGAWSPGSFDGGNDEGLYFQFDGDVEVNFIQVTFADAIYDSQTTITAYLDGKTTTPGLGVVEAYAKPVDSSGDKVFHVVARDGFGNTGAPLNTKLRSFFLKLDHWKKSYVPNSSANEPGKTPTIKRIAFFKEYTKDEDGKWKLEKPIEITFPTLASAEATATSILPPVFVYDPSHLFDSMLDMAWATDGSKSLGKGETLIVKFKEAQNISELLVWNGYQRSQTHFTANARVQSLLVSGDDRDSQKVPLSDKSGVQAVKLEKPLSGVKKVALKIDSIYPGTKYKDVLISELRFKDSSGKMIIPETIPPKPAEPTLLKNIVDRSFAKFLHEVSSQNECYGPCSNASIRIRSNGTFVIYHDFDRGLSQSNGAGGAVTAGVIEGNWEAKGNAIRIFGKKYTTSLRSSEYLQGNAKESKAAIFQSEMTFTWYRNMPSSDRMKLLSDLFAAAVSHEKSTENKTDTLSWHSTLIPTKKDDATVHNYKASTKKALLEEVNKDLEKRNPVYIKSSVFSGLVAPTDDVEQCWSGC